MLKSRWRHIHVTDDNDKIINNFTLDEKGKLKEKFRQKRNNRFEDKRRLLGTKTCFQGSSSVHPDNLILFPLTQNKPALNSLLAINGSEQKDEIHEVFDRIPPKKPPDRDGDHINDKKKDEIRETSPKKPPDRGFDHVNDDKKDEIREAPPKKPPDRGGDHVNDENEALFSEFHPDDDNDPFHIYSF